MTVDDTGAIAALISDLHWQIDQMVPRGIKNAAGEALIADPGKPYAYLFNDGEREVARARIAHHLAAIESRNTARTQRIAKRRVELPDDIKLLREQALRSVGPEEAVAINTEILERTPNDGVALNRIGRAYEALGLIDDAKAAFCHVLRHDPTNQIASRRLRELNRSNP